MHRTSTTSRGMRHSPSSSSRSCSSPALLPAWPRSEPISAEGQLRSSAAPGRAATQPGSGERHALRADPAADQQDRRDHPRGRHVGESLGRVRALAVELGGYVGGSQAGTLEDSATLTLRVPAAGFEMPSRGSTRWMPRSWPSRPASRTSPARSSTSARGSTISRRRKSRTVSSSRAPGGRGHPRRPVAARPGPRRVRAADGPARGARGPGRAVHADRDAGPGGDPGRATAEGWDPGSQLDQALAALVGIGQGLLNGLIWFGVLWLPVLLVLAAIVLIALRGVLEVRRRMPAPPTAAARGP